MTGQELINEVKNLDQTIALVEHDHERLNAAFHGSGSVSLFDYLNTAQKSLASARCLLMARAGEALAAEALR